MAEHRQKIIDNGAFDTSLIDAPCYVLWGQSDAILRAEWSDDIQVQITNTTVEIAEDAEHFVQYEQPALANPHIISFLSGL